MELGAKVTQDSNAAGAPAFDELLLFELAQHLADHRAGQPHVRRESRRSGSVGGDHEPQRQGLGGALTSALAAAAAGRGARRALLQVETGNASARALYFRCGFRDSHRYHYMIAQ